MQYNWLYLYYILSENIIFESSCSPPILPVCHDPHHVPLKNFLLVTLSLIPSWWPPSMGQLRYFYSDFRYSLWKGKESPICKRSIVSHPVNSQFVLIWSKIVSSFLLCSLTPTSPVHAVDECIFLQLNIRHMKAGIYLVQHWMPRTYAITGT